jgi:hypothetical protein
MRGVWLDVITALLWESLHRAAGHRPGSLRGLRRRGPIEYAAGDDDQSERDHCHGYAPADPHLTLLPFLPRAFFFSPYPFVLSWHFTPFQYN